jgi:hypothetical protein
MTYPRNIALIAPSMGCGKTTVAKYLAIKYDYEVTPFARPMKRMIAELLRAYGFSEEHIKHAMTEGKETPLNCFPLGTTARRLLQTLGNEWGRQLISDELWIGAWYHSTRQFAHVVADDCRFLNEYRFIRQYRNSQVWRITRPGTAITAAHASEGQLDDVPVDAEIINDGTIPELLRKVDLLMEAV